MSKWTLHIFPIVFGFLRTFTIIVDLRRSKKVSEVYRVLAVEGSEARREQEKGGMSRGVKKSEELACVKIWSCVCPWRPYEMFPAICEIAASQDETPLWYFQAQVHAEFWKSRFLLPHNHTNLSRPTSQVLLSKFYSFVASSHFSL